MKTLPHYLRTGLRIVFIGYNPAIFSAEAGHYYARPGNAFWKHLYQSGLTDREVGPSDDNQLMDEFGFGFVDLCPRPTVRADELSREELRRGSQRLWDDLGRHQPRYAVLCGKGIFQHFGTHALGLPRAALAKRPYGVQPESVGDTLLHVVPSSSGLASRWHAERLQLLTELALQLGPGNNETSVPG
jgi:TDG/mug DNA glycosylase family protein